MWRRSHRVRKVKSSICKVIIKKHCLHYDTFFEKVLHENECLQWIFVWLAAFGESAAHITAHVSCVLRSIVLLPGRSCWMPEKHFSLSLSKVMFYSALRSAAPSKVTLLWLNIDPQTYRMPEGHGESRAVRDREEWSQRCDRGKQNSEPEIFYWCLEKWQNPDCCNACVLTPSLHESHCQVTSQSIDG